MSVSNRSKPPSFERSFASHPKAIYWDQTENGNITPRDVFKNCNEKFWFKCEKCNHSFDPQLDHVTRGQWCPYCGNQKLCNVDNCNFCKNKSFASHPKAIYWHQTKNGNITPRDVFKNSAKKYWFKCEKCNHSFDPQLSDVTRVRGSWCPYCCIPGQKLCNDENCNFCFNNSFASHPKAIYWHQTKNGNVTPRDVFKCSGTKYWFECEKCNHPFDARLGDVNKKDSWCPYCSIPCKKLCNDENCNFCFNNSFASHPKAIYWDQTENGNVTPRDVFKCSNTKYWFECEKCNHSFDIQLDSVTNGHWCSTCVKKTELKLYNILVQDFPDIIKQYKVDWCKNKRPLPFDFCIFNLKIIIELDGPHHFIQVSNWNTSEETKQTDKYKQDLAIKHGFSVIRITQTVVWEDNTDWKERLYESIESMKVSETNEIHYICEYDEYDE
tara:strand:- start:4040 stop:5356 length:1317 start_codon:yes stop_codon:yes gene_type:complete